MMPRNLDIVIRNAISAFRRIDHTDLQVLEGISRYGPRNISQVAEYVRIPSTTIRFRLARMLQESFLFLHMIPYLPNLGLQRAVVFLEANTGFENDILNYSKIHDYWVFQCSIFGRFDGCAGLWNIPIGEEDKFIEFFNTLVELGVVRDYHLHWITSAYYPGISSKWYRIQDKTWVYNWEEFFTEISVGQGDKVPEILRDPNDYSTKVDAMDLQIINELEENAKLSLPEISKLLDVPLSKIKYHYNEHIVKKNLISGYQVEIYRFPFPLCEILFFIFDFDNSQDMNKFISALIDKPISINISKIIGQNSIISQVYLPKWELRNFIKLLSRLTKLGYMKSYSYYIQDMYESWRELIPIDNYDDGWICKHDQYIDAIKNIHEK